MILVWMLYATVLAALFGGAAMALETLFAARGRPRRAVWIAAIIGSLTWPAVAALARSALPTARLAPIVVTPLNSSMARASTFVSRARSMDTLLLSAWSIATLALLVRLAAGRRTLRRRRGEWEHASIDGMPVRLSPNVGPAVVGLRRMEIVLPRWALALDAPLRALVLRHEEEHRVARDPWLLLVAALGVALMPWNVGLWWHARRLRLAIEMDCDARVLRAHPRRERYGLLLLAIAQRPDDAPLLAPALSEPVSQLERRIDAMSAPTITRTRLIAAAFLAVLTVAIACAVESPTTTAGPTPVSANQVLLEFQVERPAVPLPDNKGPRYPDALREAGVEGEVLAQFVVERDGRVDIRSFKVTRSTDPQFTEAVKGALQDFRFSPAQVGGRPVRQLVQMPFQFSLRKPPTAPPTSNVR